VADIRERAMRRKAKRPFDAIASKPSQKYVVGAPLRA
jgi:DICT domain-containing protein